MNQAFAYDSVDYPSSALPQAHPGHLHAVSQMFGAESAKVERCRYLEIGCGEGTHLIAAAIGLPDATFVGIDLSSAAIERGNRIIAELGLPNVTLSAADLTCWEPPAEGFDYAIAHGLYSWIPTPIRDGLMALLSRGLRQGGIGYVSYNAYPGCYVRRMLWEMLRFHTAEISDPAAKIKGAIELTKFLSAGCPKKKDAPLALLAPELNEILENRDPRVLYHDELGEVNEPVYFHEFMAHAGRHGLHFVAEAEQYQMETRGFPREVAGVLNGLAANDVLRKEQYIDFLLLRRFRHTLLARDGNPPREDPDPSRIASLFVSGNPKPDGDSADLAPKVAVTFRAGRDAAARTDLAIGKAALVVLGSRWPARIAFAELVRIAAQKLGRPFEQKDEEDLGSLLTAIWMTGMIELHGHNPRYVEGISERPVASPLARIQLRSGAFASTLLHGTMRFDDEPSRLLLKLCDGTRNLTQIARSLSASFPADKRPDPDSLMEGIKRNLERLAKGGLLVG
jgi:hypothetical protein